MKNGVRKPTVHKKEIILDKKKLKEILDSRGMGYIEFYDKLVDIYGLDISYKGFMSLLQNRSTWKLLYAYAITKTLNVSITDLFVLIDVDVEKVKKEKEKWKERYQKEK